MNGQRKGCDRHMCITHNLLLDTKVLFFSFPAEPRLPKNALILDPGPKARPTGSIGYEKDIFLKMAIGKSGSLANYLSTENVDTIFKF